jgi:hypothetical protein
MCVIEEWVGVNGSDYAVRRTKEAIKHAQTGKVLIARTKGIRVPFWLHGMIIDPQIMKRCTALQEKSHLHVVEHDDQGRYTIYDTKEDVAIQAGNACAASAASMAWGIQRSH